MKKKIIGVLMAAVMLTSSFVGCGSSTDDSSETSGTSANSESSGTSDSADSDGEITIAFVGPFTGDNAYYGETMLAGVQIAVDEWNENGGVLGMEIKLVTYDDANTSEQAASVAAQIVSDASISAVIGHFSSGVAMTAAEVYQEAGIPFINGSAAHMDLAAIGDCIFRNNAIYATDANTMLQIMSYLGVSKFGIINPNTDAGVSVTSECEEMIERYGDAYTPEMVEPQYYEDGTVDFSATVAWFEEQGVEAIYTSGAYSAAAPLIQQYLAINPDMQFVLSASCFGQEFLDLAGDDAEGVVLGTSFFYGAEDEKVQSFNEKYQEMMDGDNASTFAAQVYDAAYAIFYAIEATGSADRDAIVAELPNTNFDGITGKITFDEEGNCPKEQVLLKIENGDYYEIPDVLMNETDYDAEMGI